MPDRPRWQQRLDEYRRTLDLLRRTDAIRRDRPLTEAEEAGMIQFFNLVVELGWKTMALRLREDGVTVPTAPLPAIREAMRAGLIEDGDGWAAAVEQRNRMAHVYDPRGFAALLVDVPGRFVAMFEALPVRLA
jgi:nucleotidyltransferase substrate binding protein (TIGR01987 family)